MTDADLPGLGLAVAAGAAVGGLYLGLLWRALRAQARGGGGAARILLGGLVRVMAVAGAAAAALAAGVPALHLVAALAGFLLARVAGTRLVGRAARP
jgi:hypothetical protein